MIWTRYIYRETSKAFSLIFFSLFFLVMCIDYGAHMKTFLQEDLTFIDVALYYLDQLSQQAELLAGVALLLSCVHVVTTLNSRGEIVAMAVSGVRIRKLMGPVLHIALFFTALLYLNAQFFQPISIVHLRSFEDHFFKSSAGEVVHSLLLEDHSTLLYQKYDPTKRQFFDVFWIIDHNEIYRCKYLSPFLNIPCGIAVDRIVRNREGELGVEKSFEKLEFP
ncbi:MAG: LptF/LptG family permease, partial [Chlamydiales bacterium]